jgi:hypothetical protein
MNGLEPRVSHSVGSCPHGVVPQGKPAYLTRVNPARRLGRRPALYGMLDGKQCF